MRTLGILLALVAATAWWWDHRGTTSRLRRNFGLGRTEVADEGAITNGLLRRLPLGSPRASVEAYIRESIRGDELSTCELVVDSTGLDAFYCHLEYDVSEIDFVKESYSIWFLLDREGRLKEVSVDRMLTGL